MQPVISNEHVHVYLIKMSKRNEFLYQKVPVLLQENFIKLNLEQQAPNVTIFTYNKT